MKKIIAIILAMLMMCSVIFVGCNKEAKDQNKDYSEFPFADVAWTREGDHDFETIRFGADGSFSYSCACGNPVNDADLCEGYSYDDESKTITLECIEVTDEMITVIKIVKCDDKELHLDFNGEILVFVKQGNM